MPIYKLRITRSIREWGNLYIEAPDEEIAREYAGDCPDPEMDKMVITDWGVTDIDEVDGFIHQLPEGVVPLAVPPELLEDRGGGEHAP